MKNNYPMVFAAFLCTIIAIPAQENALLFNVENETSITLAGVKSTLHESNYVTGNKSIYSINNVLDTATFSCAYPDNLQEDTRQSYSYGIDLSAIEDRDIVVLNIYFWSINPQFGQSENPLEEEQALTIVAELNSVYNSLKVFFKYRGMGEYASAEHYITENTYLLSLEAKDRGFYKEDAFNIYVPLSLTYACGTGSPSTNLVTMGSYCISPARIVHEIGHNFGLSHTHSNWRTAGQLCENVTRDESDPNYNADVAGDFVTDTAAAPNFITEHFFELVDAGITNPSILANYEPHKYIDPDTCLYSNPTATPFNDTAPYEIFEQDSSNYMSYNLDNCRAYFTNGQKIKMRETIDNDISGIFQEISTNIASLYEPYKGSYYLIGPITRINKPLLQPGFSYRFYDCSGNNFPQPAPYDENFNFNTFNFSEISATEEDYNSIMHLNHTAIQIDQIDKAQGWSQVKRCYDNINRVPISGTIIKFEDNILNTNVSILQKGAVGINTPSLINTLENGLYKIEKRYPDGSIEEKIVFKDY